MVRISILFKLLYILYFSDYKMHFFPQIWEEHGGASYSLNVVYIYIGEILFMLLDILPHFLLQNFFRYFPPPKRRCILWSKKYGIVNAI